MKWKIERKIMRKAEDILRREELKPLLRIFPAHSLIYPIFHAYNLSPFVTRHIIKGIDGVEREIGVTCFWKHIEFAYFTSTIVLEYEVEDRE